MENNNIMVNLCLTNEERNLLKDLIGKKLIQYRHDPLNTFGSETVYARIELFFDDSILLIDYDYVPYPLFGSQDDEHPKFFVKKIIEKEAVSALKNVSQINVRCGKTITGITLVEDYVEIEWDGKKDSANCLKALILKFEEGEMTIQGDYMMPLLDIFKGSETISRLLEPGAEYKNNPETRCYAKRSFVEL